MLNYANYSRIQKQEKIGYCGTYEDQWNQLFHRGYIAVTSKGKTGNLLNLEEKASYITAVDSCIRNMEERFLGEAYQLAYFKVDQEKKHKFRKLIEEMYQKGVEKSIYQTDPFCGAGLVPFSETDSSNIYNSLNDICNFSKGYPFIQEELQTHFKECLIETIFYENMEKSKNLFKINYDFYQQLKKLEFNFGKKYENVKFHDLMKYYFKYNKEIENKESE